MLPGRSILEHCSIHVDHDTICDKTGAYSPLENLIEGYWDKFCHEHQLHHIES